MTPPIRRPLPSALVVLLLAGCTTSTGPDSVSQTSGQASDVAGDGGTADLTFVLFEVAGRTATVVANFDPASYQGDSVVATFDLDVDENPATGFASTDPGYSGLGVDYQLVIGNVDPTTGKIAARITKYQGGVFTFVQDLPIAVNSGGFVASISYDVFGDTDDLLAFRVESHRVNGDGTLSARQDWAPDAGAAPVTVR